MAKRIIDEEMRFSIIINGDDAQKELIDLEKRQRTLKTSSDELRAAKVKLTAEGKKNTAEYKKLSAELTLNNKEVKVNKARMQELQKQIGLTSLTMSQLASRAAVLRVQLRNATPGGGQFEKLQAELLQVNARMKELSLNAGVAQSSISRLASGFNKYAVIGASAIATVTGLVISMQRLTDVHGELSDAQSNVQKTTGLTKKAVAEITAQLGTFKTRTARIELLKLAEEAGRLGKESVEDVMAFVRVAEQLKIALGDELDDTAIREVGKLVEIYKVGAREGLDFEKSMLALGSSINEVSASGSNTASYLVDFLKRTAGISDVANIAAQDMVGLAAAFDEAGQSQEISATAINKFFGAAAADVAKFSKVAGVSVQEYSKMLEEDANEALIMFLKGIKKGNPTLEEMAAKLKGIELGGTRGEQAITALAANIEKLEARQKTANEALKEGTSLTDEAALKNNNLAATVEKIQNRLTNWFTSAEISDGLNNFIVWIGKFIGAVEDGDGKVTVWRNSLIALIKTVIILTAALFSYRTAVQLVALWTGTLDATSKLYIITQKIQALTTSVLRTASLLLSAAYAFLTGNLVRARAAMLLLNASMLLSPIGLVVGLIAAAGAAYLLFSENTKAAVTAQSQMNDAIKEATIETAKETYNLKQLLVVARDKTKTDKERQRAIDALNKAVPEYNNNLTIETANTLQATQALEDYITKIKEAAKEKYLKALVDQKAEELAKAETSSLEDNLDWWDKTVVAVQSFGSAGTMAVNSVNRALKNQKETVAELNRELEMATKNHLEQQNKNISSNESTGPKEGDVKSDEYGNYIFKNGKWEIVQNKSVSTGTTGSKDNTAEKRADQLKKEADALLQLQRETEDNRLAMIQDAFKREMAINDVAHRRKIEDLQKQADETLSAFDNAEGDTELQSLLLKKHDQLLDQIEQAEQQHQNKRSDILTSGVQTHIQIIEEQFKREELARETAFNNEMAALGNNEKAKEALQNEYDKDKLERQKEATEAMIAELNKILESAEFKDFDLEFLSAEQLQALKGRMQELGYSISEINKLLAVMQGKSTGPVDVLGATRGGIDILGFSVDEWETTFGNLDSTKAKMEAVVMTATAMLNAYQIFSEFQSQNEDKRLQKLERNNQQEKNKQASLLERKFISQKQHDDAVKNLDKELEKKKAEIAYKQAKREKAMAMASIAIQTGQAIMGIWAQVPKVDFGISAGILTGIVGALGLVQLAMVASQPLPAKGFEKGYGMVRREQDGKMFNAAYGGPSRSGIVNKPTVFLAGEGGKNFPEMIIDGPTLKQFNPDLKESLHRELGRIKGFESGFYKNEQYQVPAEANANNMALAAVLGRAVDVLERLEENGVIAYMSKDLANIKKMRDELERLKKIENKAKINT